MEWGSFSASPTELIDFRHDVPSSHLTPTAPLFRFSAPFAFLREQRGIVFEDLSCPPLALAGVDLERHSQFFRFV